MDKTITIVIDLMPYYLDKGHYLYNDNFFNPFSITKYLPIYLSGILRKDRKNNPTNVKNRKLKKGEIVRPELDNAVVLKWKDKQDVYATPNVHTP